jgi:predicted ATPase/DNA-binding CsgD family transcriptional regulator
MISGSETLVDGCVDRRKTGPEDGGGVRFAPGRLGPAQPGEPVRLPGAGMAIAPERRHPQPGNLPAELSSFVGRRRELSEIRRLLPAARALTLTGPGGIGKSRLALHAAHKLGRHFRDGVWLVELAGLDTPTIVPDAVAQALGVHEQPDRTVEETLLTYLQARDLLLVLDNCEHLAEACRAVVGQIVSGCEGVRVLCTSRERLGVAGEAVVLVAGLEIPAEVGRLPTTSLADVAALRLLVDRAEAVSPEFVLTQENCEGAIEICRRLDGSPLAIELAAARLGSLGVDDLVERLGDRFRLLASDRRAGSERHRTLRATVEWSHGLLAEEERILWRRLSVFAGSFGLDAAEAVCSGEGLERELVIDALGSLVDKSILTMSQGRRGRYALLETMRLYGAERLQRAGEEDAFQRRLADWCAELVSGGEQPWWGSSRQADVLETLDLEWANVEAALDFCAQSSADAQLGLRMSADLWLHWNIRGRYRSGCRHLETFLALVPAPSTTRAMALWAFGFLAQAAGDHAAALASFEEARRVAERSGGDRELAYALFGLALAELRLGELATAAELGAQSRERAMRVDDPMARALCLYFLATAVAADGQLTKARVLAQEGLAASEQAGEALGRGLLNALVGILEWLLGTGHDAEARLEEALRTQSRIGHRWGVATSLEGLAWVAGSSGRLERAALLLGASAALWQELGNPFLPYWRVHHDGCEATVRTGLGEARYRACWEKGFAFGWEQKIAAALGDAAPAERHPSATGPDDASELTARELEVARLVADGLSNPAIAAALFVSVATVKTHVSHILRKLGLESRTQLAGWVAAHHAGSAAPPQRPLDA